MKQTFFYMRIEPKREFEFKTGSKGLKDVNNCQP